MCLKGYKFSEYALSYNLQGKASAQDRKSSPDLVTSKETGLEGEEVDTIQRTAQDDERTALISDSEEDKV